MKTLMFSGVRWVPQQAVSPTMIFVFTAVFAAFLKTNIEHKNCLANDFYDQIVERVVKEIFSLTKQPADNAKTHLEIANLQALLPCWAAMLEGASGPAYFNARDRNPQKNSSFFQNFQAVLMFTWDIHIEAQVNVNETLEHVISFKGRLIMTALNNSPWGPLL